MFDLAEVGRPEVDEPKRPRSDRHTNEHPRRRSALVDSDEALVLVMAEYNYRFSAPPKNAVDYLTWEWR